jgi:hypothetical protein
MSDIFQEVEEDLRRERLKRVWDRYGIYVIAAAVLIVVVTAGWRGWEAWTTSRERAAGDAFAVLIQEADDALPATAAENLIAYAADAPEGYAMLARFRAASAYEAAGDLDDAVATLRTIAADAPDELYQDLARVRLAALLLDMGEPTDARDVVADLANDSSSPFYRSAQEMLGLAAYAQDDIPAARRWYQEIVEGAGTPPSLRQRAELMLALFDQTTAAAPDEDAAVEETN